VCMVAVRMGVGLSWIFAYLGLFSLRARTSVPHCIRCNFIKSHCLDKTSTK
jgi:hypothetical protein